MARIRSVHPSLVTDEAYMELTVEAPLAIPLLLGLWMEADDAGVFEWKKLTIKARVLPAPAIDIEPLLNILAEKNFIRRFEVEGKIFGVVRNFARFQRPKEPKEVHPASGEMRAYAGFTGEGKRPNAGTGRKSNESTSEPLPKSAGTPSEKSPQMEEGGGKREEEGEKKVIPLRGSAVAPPDLSTDAGIFAYGKSVLGKSAGGVINKLVKHCDRDLRTVASYLMQASEKENAMEWVQGVLRHTERPKTPEHILIPDDIYRGVL